jgi:hypothetical protein
MRAWQIASSENNEIEKRTKELAKTKQELTSAAIAPSENRERVKLKIPELEKQENEHQTLLISIRTEWNRIKVETQ